MQNISHMSDSEIRKKINEISALANSKSSNYNDLQIQEFFDTITELEDELASRRKSKLKITPVLNAPVVASHPKTKRTAMSLENGHIQV